MFNFRILLNFFIVFWVEAEHQAQEILWKAGIVCPQPVKNLKGNLTSLEKIVYKTSDKTWIENNGNYVIKLDLWHKMYWLSIMLELWQKIGVTQVVNVSDLHSAIVEFIFSKRFTFN